MEETTKPKRGRPKKSPGLDLSALAANLEEQRKSAQNALQAIQESTDLAWLRDVGELVTTAQAELSGQQMVELGRIEAAMGAMFAPVAKLYDECKVAITAKLPLEAGAFGYKILDVNQIPRQFFSPIGLDTSLLQSYINAKDGACIIPGVEVLRG
jgi:hypothetical protein